MVVVIGARGEGLNTIVLPAANAGATFQVAPQNGKFHEPIAVRMIKG
jgi:hypothetical protein